MKLFGLAVRNLLRAKRRNALAGGTMALGTAALILGGGLSDGIASQLTDSLVAVQTGELMLVKRDPDYVAQNSPFDTYSLERIQDAVALAKTWRDDRDALRIESAIPYLHTRGNAIALNRSTPAVLLGIVPSLESALFRALPPVKGEVLTDASNGLTYIAEPAARKLKIDLGDPVSFVIQTPEGAINSIDATVTGIFRKGAPWYDNTFFITLPDAQRLVDAPGTATNVKVRVRGSERSHQAVRSVLEHRIPQDRGLIIETQREAGRFAFAIVQANEAALWILSLFLFAAASVGIVNSMLMSVHERTREIGTIRALGLRRSGVVRLFVFEGLALGIVAAAVGVIAGGAGVLYLSRAGIEMNTVTLAWLAGGDTLFPRLEVASVLRAVGAIVAISTLAAVYPAFAASRLEPREAIHHI